MAKAKLGSGSRFKALSKKVGSDALAAFIGRKKYGAKKFQAMSAAGRSGKSVVKARHDTNRRPAFKFGGASKPMRRGARAR